MNAAEFYLEDLKSKFSKIDPTKYYLAYSGGRDSHLLYWFIKNYLKEPRIEIVYSNTGMDIPEIMARGMANSDRRLHPTMHPMQIKEKYGIPCFNKRQDEHIYRYMAKKEKGVSDEDMPNYLKWHVFRDPVYDPKGQGRISQFAINKRAHDLLMSGKLHKVSHLCCSCMKKIPAHKYVEESGKHGIIGIMGAESMRRAAIFKQMNSCFNRSKDFYPIHDLTHELQEQIEKEFQIEVPRVYQYANQTGCAGCPYGIHRGSQSVNLELNLLTETRRQFVLEYFAESYKVKKFVYEPKLIL